LDELVFRLLHAVGVVLLIVLMVVLVTWTFKVCWNHAICHIFKLPSITKKQAFGFLVVLSFVGGALSSCTGSSGGMKNLSTVVDVVRGR